MWLPETISGAGQPEKLTDPCRITINVHLLNEQSTQQPKQMQAKASKGPGERQNPKLTLLKYPKEPKGTWLNTSHYTKTLQTLYMWGKQGTKGTTNNTLRPK